MVCASDFSICKLNEITTDFSRWGRKASCLSEIVKAGLPVPQGLVIGTEWFKKYSSKCFRNKNEKAFEGLLVDLQNSIYSSGGWKEIAESSIIARSSATLESKVGVSFSGIFESTIIEDSNKIIDAIKKVWDSTNNLEIKNYIKLHKVSFNIEMAIILQTLVTGDYSGIVHTKDVITGDKDKIFIEYEDWRLGAVVNGNGLSESIKIDKISGDIIGEIKKHNVIYIMNELFKLSNKCEDLLGGPLEIEWVSDHDQIWIVQTRFLE